MGPQSISQSALSPGVPPFAVVPCRRGFLGRCARPSHVAHGPIAYSRYLERQNRRDPDPRLSDVFERSNLATPPGPSGAGWRVQESAARVEASSAVKSVLNPASLTNAASLARLYGAPRVGDVTPGAVVPVGPPATRTLVRTLTARDGGFDTIV